VKSPPTMFLSWS